MAIFYNHGLRPAIESVVGLASDEWPANYANELFRAQNPITGQFSFLTKTIAACDAGLLAGEIRRAFRRTAHAHYAEGLVVLHQIRGTKSSFKHDLEANPYERMNNFLSVEGLSLRNLLFTGKWWIDVGVEISDLEGRCLAWRTDAHTHITQQILEVEPTVAQRLTKPGSSKYSRDLTSHLTSISGCRIEPGVRGRGPHNISFLQLYTTDKSVLYHPIPEYGKFGKFITCMDVLKGKSASFLSKLWTLYFDAIQSNIALARMEVRLELSQAINVFFDLDPAFIRGCLYAVPSEDFW